VKYIVYFLSFLESQTISFKSVLRFVKLAYNYENWETFDHLLAPVLEELSGYPEHQLYVAESKVLQMLGSMASLNSSRLRRKFVMLKTEDHGETNLSKNCMWFFFNTYIPCEVVILQGQIAYNLHKIWKYCKEFGEKLGKLSTKSGKNREFRNFHIVSNDNAFASEICFEIFSLL